VADGMDQEQTRIAWTDGQLDLEIEVTGDGAARLTRLSPRAPAAESSGSEPLSGPPPGPGLPLVDIVVAGEGRSWSGSRYTESVVGRRLRYLDHEDSGAGRARRLRVELEDPVTGLHAELYIQSAGGGLRSWVRLSNTGQRQLTIQSVTTLLIGGLPGPDHAGRLEDLDLMWARSDWLAEGRWERLPLRDALPDLNQTVHRGASPRGRLGLSSQGTWSTAMYLPAGAVVDRRTGRACAWQIEHNGGWHWQVGEAGGRGYLALLGPTDTEHDWHVDLPPGGSFTTVPAAVAVSEAGFEGAIAGLTGARRAGRRPHPDHRQLPVIFNDYMNTLMGDPTTAVLLPLIDAAAEAGAEYFCIDSGWYTEVGEGWWDAVGAWKPSVSRFPGGLPLVLDRIRAAGMVPGMWLEPEVVGVRSPVAEQLPPEAFFQRDGQRVVEHGRYHLDLRHPAAVKHLDEVVDFLVSDLGVGYFKLDYNINGGPGTDTGGGSPGAGLLEANRAHLAWLDRMLDRHPGLTIENCASGGMRADYAMLSRLQLQSTSDQQDYLRYAPIAAAAPATIAPEQAAIWAYPQPSFTDDEIAFTLCTALLGRVHLSGHLDQMSPQQRGLVAAAVAVYKGLRADLAEAVPFWPLGLPGWEDPVIALGMRAPGASYVVVWRRGGDAERIALPVPGLAGGAPEVLFPAGAGAAAGWRAEAELVVTLPRAPSACLIRLPSGGEQDPGHRHVGHRQVVGAAGAG
jgi:alpha-galactosidase